MLDKQEKECIVIKMTTMMIKYNNYNDNVKIIINIKNNDNHKVT